MRAVNKPVDQWRAKHDEYIALMHREGKHRLVVSAVIYAGDHVLVVRRGQDDSHAGMWEYPGGGVDEIEGEIEHYLDAVIREIGEETGIELPMIPSEESLVHSTRTAIRIVMRFNLDEIPEVALSDEHDAFAWLHKDTFRTAQAHGDHVYGTMREENKQILDIVFENGRTRTL